MYISEIATEQPTARHNRRVPAEWQNLEDFSAQQLATHRSKAGAVLSVYDAVDSLSDEQLDANRYFGFGKIGCNLAQGLQNPSVKDQVIERSGLGLAHYYLSSRFDPEYMLENPRDRPPYFTVRDLQPEVLSLGFADIVQRSSDALAEETQLLADVLTVAGHVRAMHRDNPAHPIELPAQACSDTLNGRAAAKAVTSDTMTGVSVAYIESFRAEYGREAGLEKPIMPENLRSLDMSFVMPQLASLHISVLRRMVMSSNAVGSVMKPASGQLRVAPRVLQAVPSNRLTAFSRHISLHQQALRCPALTIPGLIPLVASSVPDILETAQAKLAAVRR